MAEIKQIFKCQSCDNIVEIMRGGYCDMYCCNKPMLEERPNTDDTADLEKHVPVITETEKGYKIQIGATKHPMIPEHHIEWIELIADGRVYRKELNAGDEPVAEFCVDKKAVKSLEAREYCNLHHLWLKEV